MRTETTQDHLPQGLTSNPEFTGFSENAPDFDLQDDHAPGAQPG